MLKRLTVLLLCLALVIALPACSGTDEGEDTSAPETTEAPETESLAYFPVVESGKGKASIVTSVRGSSLVTAAGSLLFSAVYEATGVLLNNDYAHEDEKTFEILIGDTAREESIELKKTLSEHEFAVKVMGTKLVFVGYDDLTLAEGVSYFITMLLPDAADEVGDGVLRIDKNFEYRSAGDDYTGFWTMLSSADTLEVVKTDELFTVRSPNPTNWPQGGCIKDGFYYQAFILKASDEKNNTVMIVKIDLETGAVVKTSNNLSLNHCNDLTYNAKLNQFVVCHNNPYRTKLSFVDPDTLRVVGSTEISQKIYSIDYNESRDRYVVGLSGGQSFAILDSDFNLIGGPYQPTGRTKGYTTQGVTSDDQYIYFVLYKENVITVYDWSGDFVSLIKLNVGDIEPESIAIVGNEIYVLCGSAGKGQIFRLRGFLPKS